MNYVDHGWGMNVGWLIALLIIAIFFYLFQGKKKEKSDAQEILDRRYASGGIDKEEYEEKSKFLQKY
jgi:putative membrane protein